jgi:hypothetical protein
VDSIKLKFTVVLHIGQPDKIIVVKPDKIIVAEQTLHDSSSKSIQGREGE